MKTTLSLILILVSASAFSQELQISEKTGLITYEQEFKLDTMKADQIYARAYSWIVKTFRSTDKVILGEDKPSLIKGQFTSDYPLALVQQTFWHQFQIKVKDGAAKIVIDNIENRSTSTFYPAESYWIKKDGSRRNYIPKTWIALESNLRSLSNDLGKHLESGGKEDW